jgi:putative DNA primase/helicase
MSSNENNNELKNSQSPLLVNKPVLKSDIEADADKLLQTFEPIPHDQILDKLLDQIEKKDFRVLTGLKDDQVKLGRRHFLICSIEEILRLARLNNWGICINHGFIYLYNGAYWKVIDAPEFKIFLGKAAERMGIDKYDARLYSFREQLYNQFIAVSHLPKPENSNDLVLINLKNGTFEITIEKQIIRPPLSKDFLLYQLPFEFEPNANCPKFQEFIDRVLPNKELQIILAEYLGYIFIKGNKLKLEKALLLYGPGSNGKSVYFDIVTALLGGDKNVSNYTLQSLTNENGYYRAMLANVLVNYSSEINGKMETAVFKKLVSGEPVDARLPYGEPFTLPNYGKLMFNCNELPKDVEHTPAYYRRFLIIPFSVTIPESEQDKELALKIIHNELPGVFNWVLEGLKRLLLQKNFTKCEIVDKQIEEFKKESDSMLMFLEDENYVRSTNDYEKFKDVYIDYRIYCIESGYHPCSKRSFSQRLKNNGFNLERRNTGMIVFIKKENVL